MEPIVNERTGYLAAVTSALALAFTGICISYLSTAHQMDTLVLAFWRNGLLVGALFPILEIGYPKLVEIDRRELFRMIGFGMVLALFNYLWTLSVALNGAAVATFLVYSSVPFTSLLGWLILDETPSPAMFPAVVCSIIGCLLISGAWEAHGTSLSFAGIGAGFGSGGCFAIYSLIGRATRKRGISAWTAMLYSFTCAAMLLFAGRLIEEFFTGATLLSAATGFFSLGASVSGWSVLVFLAVGPTLLGYGLYTISLGYLPSGTVNLISTLEPVLTAVFAYLLLGEMLSFTQVLGAVSIILAVLILRLAKHILPSYRLAARNLSQHPS